MSLLVNAELSVEVLSRLMADGGKRTVWKGVKLNVWEEKNEHGDVEVVDAELHSPIRHGYKWEPGWLEAKGEMIVISYHGQMVNAGGLHLFLTKPNGLELLQIGRLDAYMPLTVLAEDFIAAGYTQQLGMTNLGRLADTNDYSLPIQVVFRKAYLSYSDAEMTVKMGLEERERKKASWKMSGPATSALQTNFARQLQDQQLHALQSGILQIPIPMSPLFTMKEGDGPVKQFFKTVKVVKEKLLGS